MKVIWNKSSDIGSFTLEAHGMKHTGNAVSVVRAMKKLGVEPCEIAYGFEDLIMTGADAALYGMFNHYICSVKNEALFDEEGVA